MADEFDDDVIVCGLVAYGDADLIVRCFTRSRGRIAAFARRARGSKKRFAGLSAPCTGVARLSERRSGDLLDLKELDVDTRLAGLGADLRVWGFCGYVCELVERFVPEGAPQPELFATVRDTLCALVVHGGHASILRAFELQLLSTLGVLPDLSDVVDEPGSVCVAYDPVSCHLMAHGGAGCVPFDDVARQCALFLLAGDADAAASLPVDDDALLQVSRLFSSWLRRQGVTLRSLDVIRATS